MDGQNESSPAFASLKGESGDIYEFFEVFLAVYNNGFFDSLIDFVKPEGRILLHLVDNGGMSHPSTIADALGLSRPNVAANLRNLEKEGFITRETDKANRRRVFVKVTPAGMDSYREQTSTIVKTISEWLKAIGPEEEAHLVKILKISKALSEKAKVPAEQKKVRNVWDIA